MFTRKSYLILLLVSIIVAIISMAYIANKSDTLITYWGSDYIAEIYQHSYSLDKFFIQIGVLSTYSIVFSLILLIFNFKKRFLIYTILFLTIVMFIITHLSLNVALTDWNITALGTIDLAK